MVDAQPELSFGRYLRGVREQRGVHLQEVSEQTKIPVYILRELEAETLSRLPETVYMKGFIRSYAEAVGANPMEALRLYREKTSETDNLRGFRRNRQKTRKRFWPGMAVCLVGFFGIVFVSIMGVSLVKDKSSTVHEPQLGASTGTSGADVQEVGSQQKVSVSNLREVNEPAPAEGYLLDMKAVFDTWVRVTIDDHGPKEYQLKTGDQLALKAASGFLLHIGDPNGVIMQFNGKPFLIEGKSGKSVKLKLP